jgi:hypothetical protein
MKAVHQIVDTENTEFMQKANGRWNSNRGVNLREIVKGSQFKDESIDNRELQTKRSGGDAARALLSQRRQVRLLTNRTVKVLDDSI